MTSSSRDHLRAHLASLSTIAVISVVGALAAFLFQVLTARFLGVADFGLLSAFLAVVSVAAVGSSALQNSVAVQTASASTELGERGRFVPRDSLLIGGAAAVVLAAFSPLLAGALQASVGVVLAAAVCVLLSFVFAELLGRVQGQGHSRAAVAWSTTSLVVRVVLIIPAVLLGFGVAGAVGAVVLATAAAAACAAWSARRAPGPTTSVFTRDGLTVIVLSIAVAWLTSADVVFLRILAPVDVAGSYAAVAVLVKASFILPSTLSLYLLPRFARNRDNAALTRAGVRGAVAAAAVSALLVVVVFAVAGGPIVTLLYGESYSGAASLMLPVAVAYVPWIILQGLMIPLTAAASRAAALVAVCAVLAQTVLFLIVLPSVAAMLVSLAAIGFGTLIALAVISRRRPSAAPRKENS